MDPNLFVHIVALGLLYVFIGLSLFFNSHCMGFILNSFFLLYFLYCVSFFVNCIVCTIIPLSRVKMSNQNKLHHFQIMHMYGVIEEAQARIFENIHQSTVWESRGSFQLFLCLILCLTFAIHIQFAFKLLSHCIVHNTYIVRAQTAYRAYAICSKIKQKGRILYR